MRNIRILFVFIISAFLLSSCIGKRYKHYVYAYITSFGGIDTIHNGYCSSKIIEIGIDYKKNYTYVKEDDASGIFECLSERNYDMSYNGTANLASESLRRIRRVFLSERIVDVDVTSDVAWDASHPVGSSLKDLFIFFSGSPDSYINSGYRSVDEYALGEFFRRFPNLSKYGQNLYSGSNGTMVPFADKLSEIEFYKYNLINAWHGNLFLLFPAVPIPAPETKVTISMTLSNGKTYTASKILKQQ